MQCGRRHHKEQYCDFFVFGPVIQGEMSFKDISYLELWRDFCSVEQTICARLVEGFMRNNSAK